MTKQTVQEAVETLEKIGLATCEIKKPTNFTVINIEINGDLCIIRGSLNTFGKIRDVTRVYKVVKNWSGNHDMR